MTDRMNSMDTVQMKSDWNAVDRPESTDDNVWLLTASEADDSGEHTRVPMNERDASDIGCPRLLPDMNDAQNAPNDKEKHDVNTMSLRLNPNGWR